MYDLLIKNGTVIDGTGAPRFQADVAVKDGKIAKIAAVIEEEAEQVIDAKGLIVSPGFIDTHTHSDGTVFNPESTGYNHLEDGSTTELAGQCGSMVAPYYGEFDPSRGIEKEEYVKICEKTYTASLGDKVLVKVNKQVKIEIFITEDVAMLAFTVSLCLCEGIFKEAVESGL